MTHTSANPTARPAPPTVYWLFQLVASSGGYLMNHLYLARASTPALLDAEAKRRVAQVLGAGDYVHKRGPQPEQVSKAIDLQDGQSIRLAADISYTEDYDKIVWRPAASQP